MARPKSDDKKMALLNAATLAVGTAGTSASTAQIARNAGVAEGTLFRYFTTKDELLNALYLHLKQGLCRSMMTGFEKNQDIKACTLHIWNRFIAWGLENRDAHLAMRQLAVSEKITEQTRQKVAELYPELHELAQHCIRRNFLNTQWRPFADAIFFGLAETSMEFARNHPEQAAEFIAAGFEAMWRALSTQE